MFEDLSCIKGVIFDLDGTLVDSYSGHTEAWIRAVARFGVSVTEEDVRPHMGRSSEDICRALMGKEAKGIEKAYSLKDKIYYDIIPEALKPVEGAVDVVSGLKMRGYLISIASSNPVRVITRSLEAVGLKQYADSIASHDEVKAGKPAPDLLVLAQKKLGLDPEKCLAVGDTCFDVLAAKAAGMATAAFTGGCQSEEELGRSRPDILLGNLRKLLQLLPESPSRQ